MDLAYYVKMAVYYSTWIDQCEKQIDRVNWMLALAIKNMRSEIAQSNPDMMQDLVNWVEYCQEQNAKVATLMKTADKNLDTALAKIEELSA